MTQHNKSQELSCLHCRNTYSCEPSQLLLPKHSKGDCVHSVQWLVTPRVAKVSANGKELGIGDSRRIICWVEAAKVHHSPGTIVVVRTTSISKPQWLALTTWFVFRQSWTVKPWVYKALCAVHLRSSSFEMDKWGICSTRSTSISFLTQGTKHCGQDEPHSLPFPFREH